MTDSFSKDEAVNPESSIDEISDAYKDHPSIVKIQSKVKRDDSFDFKEITYDELYVKLKCIKSKKAMGFDGIPPKLDWSTCISSNFSASDKHWHCTKPIPQ